MNIAINWAGKRKIKWGYNGINLSKIEYCYINDIECNIISIVFEKETNVLRIYHKRASENEIDWFEKIDPKIVLNIIESITLFYHKFTTQLNSYFHFLPNENSSAFYTEPSNHIFKKARGSNFSLEPLLASGTFMIVNSFLNRDNECLISIDRFENTPIYFIRNGKCNCEKLYSITKKSYYRLLRLSISFFYYIKDKYNL